MVEWRPPKSSARVRFSPCLDKVRKKYLKERKNASEASKKRTVGRNKSMASGS